MKTTTTLLITLFTILSIPSQTVTTFTAGSPDDSIDIDSNGNIYVSSFDTGKILKFTPSGVMTEFKTGLSNPNGLAFNSSDELYSNQWLFSDINRYSTSGSLIGSYSTSGRPSGIIKAFDNEDMIFAKYLGNSIHRITPSGTISTISTAAQLDGPVGLTFDDSGNLYVGNYNNRKIHKVLSNGTVEYVATVGQSSYLGFITFAHGKLWATTTWENKIYMINPSAIDDVTIFAGSTQGSMDGSLAQATFNVPNGIKFNDSGDTMYITDYGSKNLRVISGISLSTKDFEKKDNFKIITNAEQNYLTIIGKNFKTTPIRLIILNTLGQKVLNIELTNNSNELRQQINTNYWAKGVYFVSIVSDSSINSKKVVIN